MLRQCAVRKTGSDQYLLLVPARGIPRRLVVKVHRGLVTEVQGIPEGMRVEVRDYDTPQGSESSSRKIENDDEGPYLAEVYDGSAESERRQKNEGHPSLRNTFDNLAIQQRLHHFFERIWSRVQNYFPAGVRQQHRNDFPQPFATTYCCLLRASTWDHRSNREGDFRFRGI